MDIQYPVVLRLKEELAARIYFSFDGARVGAAAMRRRDKAAKARMRRRNKAAKPSQAPAVGNHPEETDLENQTHAPRAEVSKLASTDTRSYGGVQKTAQYPTRLDVNGFLRRLNFMYGKSYGLFETIFRCFFVWNSSFRLWPPSSGEFEVTEARLRCFCRDDSPFALDLGDVGLGKDGKKCQPLCVRALMTVREGSVRSGNNVKLHSLLALVAFSIVYGGAHAAVWNTHLPTEVELLLWRISSVALAAGIPLGYCFWWLCDRTIDYAKSQLSQDLLASVYLSFTLPLILFVLLARGFLVVESFISLRSLKKGSFDVVPWSNYWPHF